MNPLIQMHHQVPTTGKAGNVLHIVYDALRVFHLSLSIKQKERLRKSGERNLFSWLNIMLLIGLMFFSKAYYAQWSPQISGTVQDLNEVFFPVADTGYIVGNKGTVLKTTNGGLNWNPLNLGVSVDLNELFFLNSQEGWLVGDSGTVAHTSNGGNTWHISYLDSAASMHLHSVYALNSNDLLVGGFNTASNIPIYKSTNGCQSWQATSVESYIWAVSILKIGMVSQTVGYAVSRGYVLKTTDGGWNWHITDTASVQAAAMFSVLEDLAVFPGKDTVYTCGWYVAYFGKTVNAGQNWSHQLNIDYTNLDFITPSIGYVGGWGSLHKTTDGGQTFSDASGGNTQLFSNIWSIDFTDEWTGYACGKNGQIIKTGNGGITGLEDGVEQKGSLLVYPNPTSGYVQFSRSTNVIVTNVLGQMVMEKKNVQSIDLSEQAKGVYFLNTSDAAGRLRERIKLLKSE
jgi:photosystem II stability/assembly factor-like uncharacterized protein